MRFTVVCTLIYNDMRHHSEQNVVDSFEWVHIILTPVMTHIVVDKSAHNAKPHSICLLPQYQRQRNCFWELKKAWRDTLTRAALCEHLLNYNGKLANQSARLVAIVVNIDYVGVLRPSVFKPCNSKQYVQLKTVFLF